MTIGRERLRQILHERGISFQRTRTWKESTDPDRDAKLDRIEHVTSAYPDRCFAFDRFGPLSIRPCHGACWARRKHPVRLRATYHRTHGIRYFHGCYCVGDDQLWGITREHKGAVHTLAALKSIRASRPGGYRLFAILDNLAANKTPAIRRWARRDIAELRLMPTNASWANPIEAHFRSVAGLRHGQLRPPEPHRRWPSCRPACAGATPTPATPTCWPPSPRTSPHPQRTLGPPQTQGCLTNPVNVRGQRASSPASRHPVPKKTGSEYQTRIPADG